MDFDWYLRVNGLARVTQWLNAPMAGYALWGGLVLLSVMLIGGWMWSRHHREFPERVAAAVLTGVSTVSVLVVNQQLVSPVIGRVRPCHTAVGVQVLLPCTGGYSMPSDHCVIAGAFAAGLFFVSRMLGAVASVLALMLAFARVYAGVHYVADVVAGLAMGAMMGLIIVVALRPYVVRAVRWVAHTPMGALVQAGRQTSVAGGADVQTSERHHGS